MNRKRILLLLLMVLLLAGPALAQVSQNFDLSWHLLSGGGGPRSSASFEIDDLLGQWADGRSVSDQFQIDPGFWGIGGTGSQQKLYFPVTLK